MRAVHLVHDVFMGFALPVNPNDVIKPSSSAAWYIRNVDTGEHVKIASSAVTGAMIGRCTLQ